MEILYWLAIIFAILAAIAALYYTVGFDAFMPMVVVDSQEAWVIDNRLGADRVIYEGLNPLMPWRDRVVRKVSLKELTIDPPEQEIITQDNINIVVDMIASVKIVDAVKAVMEVDNFEDSVKSLVMSSTLSKLGQMDFSDIQKQQDNISKEIREHMSEDCNRWGLDVVLVKFENITPPPSIKEAMEKEIVAEKEKKASVLKAEGDHTVHELHADSEKVLIEKRAEATYKVIRNLKELMPTLSDEKIMQFLTSNAYIDSMKELSASSNSKFVLYPSDVQQPMDRVMNAEYMSRHATITDTKN